MAVLGTFWNIPEAYWIMNHDSLSQALEAHEQALLSGVGDEAAIEIGLRAAQEWAKANGTNATKVKA